METITGVVRDYDWGHPQAIAELLGHDPPGHPEAEYWLGAHPSAPSRLDGSDRTLTDVITDELVPVVGPAVSERFGGIPFLLKVLAAERPLSIQAHPSLAQAKAGFARENAAGIDIAAPNRSYRDDNHKPELICALTPFEAKCGFRSVAGSRQLIDAMADDRLQPLAERLAVQAPTDAALLAETVSWLLGLSAEEASVLANAAVDVANASRSIATASALDGFAKEMDWTVRIAEVFPDDVGVVVGLLLNHVSLRPGQAIFLEAGNLHSYLQGVGVELMANSDNVLRGGLTSKHIDVPELLSVVNYEPAQVPVQTPEGPVHLFDTPVPELSLTRVASTDGEIDGLDMQPAGPEILLVTAGEVQLTSASGSLAVPAGAAALVRHDDGLYQIGDGAPGHTVAWRATVGTDLY